MSRSGLIGIAFLVWLIVVPALIVVGVVNLRHLEGLRDLNRVDLAGVGRLREAASDLQDSQALFTTYLETGRRQDLAIFQRKAHGVSDTLDRLASDQTASGGIGNISALNDMVLQAFAAMSLDIEARQRSAIANPHGLYRSPDLKKVQGLIGSCVSFAGDVERFALQKARQRDAETQSEQIRVRVIEGLLFAATLGMLVFAVRVIRKVP